jgi:hypothetical protein
MTPTPPAVTAAQAASWLFYQTHFCCAGVHGRMNMIGGLLLWRLAQRGLLPGKPPRLCLYGDHAARLRAAAENMVALFRAPCHYGRLRTYHGRGGLNDSEVLLTPAPVAPALTIVDDRHAFILLLDTGDPHRWHAHPSVARAVLPGRLFTGVEPRRPPFAVPDALDLLCDAWAAAGEPGGDGRGYSWPTETSHWRALAEGVLEASGFPHKPRSVVTVDDL